MAMTTHRCLKGPTNTDVPNQNPSKYGHRLSYKVEDSTTNKQLVLHNP